MATLEDLWPPDIKVEVLSPALILKHQADLITQKTKGVVVGEVRTVPHVQRTTYILRLASESGDYVYEAVRISHEQQKPYPCFVSASCFDSEGSLHAEARLEYTENTLKLSSDEEVKDVLRQVLGSEETTSALQSMLARATDLRLRTA